MKLRSTFSIATASFILGVIFAIALFYLLARSVQKQVASEGYPTIEAAWNICVREGQVVVHMPPEADKVISAFCKYEGKEIVGSFENEKIRFRLDYGLYEISIRYKNKQGHESTIDINGHKLNWHRVHYWPISCGNQIISWHKVVNGVESIVCTNEVVTGPA